MTHHDQYIREKSFIVRESVWLQLNKERLYDPIKKINTMEYGHFKISKKMGDNVYILSLPPYMCIYSVVNVDRSNMNFGRLS